MDIVTAGQMRALDQYTMDQLRIPALSLMENAGRAVAEEILKLCGWSPIPESAAAMAGPGGKDVHGGEVILTEPELTHRTDGHQHWYILVGKGNNGGDGLVAARHLADAGVQVTLVYAEPPDILRGEAAVQRDAAAALRIPTLIYGTDSIDLRSGTGIVDALLGTGTQGKPREPYATLIQQANRSGLPIVAADIPSGLDADTGMLNEPCIRARVTVCLAFLKRGLVQYPGAGAAGSIVVRSIGIPSQLASEQGVKVRLLTDHTLRESLGIDVSRQRDPDGHKGTYGHVLVVAGSLRMSGAGLLSARAALRIGSGLVTWAMPKALLPCIIGAAPELMLAAASEGEDGEWNADSADRLLRLAAERDVMAVGPGLGRFKGDTEWLRRLWNETDCPLVLDADGLNIWAEAGNKEGSWGHRHEPVVLTPHPGEMARLLGISTSEVQQDRINHALRYAGQHNVTLVLKGARTIITGSDGQAYINTTGHAGMATGGAGDVLTGIIAGLLAQGLSGLQAAAFGVYLHGLAGEKAAQHRGDPSSVIAGDMVEAL